MTILCLTRRDFIAVLGGAGAWPMVARGQQAATPLIGFLNTGGQDVFAPRLGVLERIARERVCRGP
jgi:hypothetical protein